MTSCPWCPVLVAALVILGTPADAQQITIDLGQQESLAARGIQLGELIEYSMPHHPAYQQHTKGKEFPNSLYCSQSMINLPIHPGLSDEKINKITSTFNAYSHGK